LKGSCSSVGDDWEVVIKVNACFVGNYCSCGECRFGFDFENYITVIVGIIKRKVDAFKDEFYFVGVGNFGYKIMATITTF
jgi:hypothetical protein